MKENNSKDLKEQRVLYQVRLLDKDKLKTTKASFLFWGVNETLTRSEKEFILLIRQGLINCLKEDLEELEKVQAKEVLNFR